MEYQFDSYGNLKTCTPEEITAIEADSDVVIALDRGTTEDGSPWWAYIRFKPSRYTQYLLARKATEAITLSDYGTVLKFGFDAEVPAAAKKIMKEHYGFDEHLRANLQKDILHARKAFLKQRDGKITDIVSTLKKDAGQA